jgi:hypothetical protein
MIQLGYMMLSIGGMTLCTWSIYCEIYGEPD